ncbi:MAG: DUF1846 domain-containing protein [Candidatus Methanomethylophilaceae archaeon]|nr:hypothetical protein [Candidatus Methanomethylophilaceae archaeon]
MQDNRTAAVSKSSKTGFDNQKYLDLQSARIKERISKFGGKLYLEFGGKLFDDFHASRVLPGFLPDSKVNMLVSIKDVAEIVIAISACDIEKNKLRSDIGITYDLEVLRLIDSFRDRGLYVSCVVVTHYSNQKSAVAFCNRLGSLNIRVYKHYLIDGYPSDIDLVVSEEGYGKNDYVETTRSLVVVTAPGPGSGKMAVCLSQLYHDNKRGVHSGYAKFETFPIWNLPLKHPINIAYEAATADLDDVNMIDPFHLETYGKTAVNYNRDIEIFPVLKAIFEGIHGESPYKSPTDMGVNMAGYCITDDEIVIQAAKDEVIRRYYWTLCDRKRGAASDNSVRKMELLMKQAGVGTEDRRVAMAVHSHPSVQEMPVAAISLPDGTIVTGKTSILLAATSAMMLNALKNLAGINDSMHLISPSVIEPVQDLKTKYLGDRGASLHASEMLIALSVCATTNPVATAVLERLPELRGCEAHSSVILPDDDEELMRKLGIHVTCDPKYGSDRLFQGR